MTHAQQLREIADRVHTGAIGTLADSEAIRAIANELEARVPMTEEQRTAAFMRADQRMKQDPNLSWRSAIVDEVEAHHHITCKE